MKALWMRHRTAARGFSMLELLVALGIILIIWGTMGSLSKRVGGDRYGMDLIDRLWEFARVSSNNDRIRLQFSMDIYAQRTCMTLYKFGGSQWLPLDTPYYLPPDLHARPLPHSREVSFSFDFERGHACALHPCLYLVNDSGDVIGRWSPTDCEKRPGEH